MHLWTGEHGVETQRLKLGRKKDLKDIRLDLSSEAR